MKLCFLFIDVSVTFDLSPCGLGTFWLGCAHLYEMTASCVGPRNASPDTDEQNTQNRLTIFMKCNYQFDLFGLPYIVVPSFSHVKNCL